LRSEDFAFVFPVCRRDRAEIVHEPKLMPWGNRAAQIRDPEGTLVSLYTPVTDFAKQRFAAR